MSKPQEPPKTAASAAAAARETRQQLLTKSKNGLEIIRQFLGWDLMPKWMRSKWFVGGSIGLATFLILATDRQEGQYAVDKRIAQERYEESLRFKDKQRLQEIAAKNPRARAFVDVSAEKPKE